jgi:hypothetical protein
MASPTKEWFPAFGDMPWLLVLGRSQRAIALAAARLEKSTWASAEWPAGFRRGSIVSTAR